MSLLNNVQFAITGRPVFRADGARIGSFWDKSAACQGDLGVVSDLFHPFLRNTNDDSDPNSRGDPATWTTVDDDLNPVAFTAYCLAAGQAPIILTPTEIKSAGYVQTSATTVETQGAHLVRQLLGPNIPGTPVPIGAGILGVGALFLVLGSLQK